MDIQEFHKKDLEQKMKDAISAYIYFRTKTELEYMADTFITVTPDNINNLKATITITLNCKFLECKILMN